jgi:hypothetical protein
VVAGDHPDLDAGRAAGVHGLDGLWPGRGVHCLQSEQGVLGA